MMKSSDITNRVWFHGTPFGHLSRFNEMSHFGTRDAALEACVRKAHDIGLERFTPSLIQVKITSLEDSEVIHLNDYGSPNSANLATSLIKKSEYHDLHSALEEIRQEIISKQNENGKSRSENSHIGHNLMAKFLRENGYKAILYKNDVEDKGSFSLQIIDTSIIVIIESSAFEPEEVETKTKHLSAAKLCY